MPLYSFLPKRFWSRSIISSDASTPGGSLVSQPLPVGAKANTPGLSKKLDKLSPMVTMIALRAQLCGALQGVRAARLPHVRNGQHPHGGVHLAHFCSECVDLGGNGSTAHRVTGQWATSCPWEQWRGWHGLGTPILARKQCVACCADYCRCVHG